MAKNQTRRSISLNRTVFDALKARAEREGIPMAQIVEPLLAGHLGVSALPPPSMRGALAATPGRGIQVLRERVAIEVSPEIYEFVGDVAGRAGETREQMFETAILAALARGGGAA